MIAAIATITFLAAAWLAIVSIARSIEDNLGKVRTALKGGTPALTAQPTQLRISPRYPQARMVRVRASPAMRAAA